MPLSFPFPTLSFPRLVPVRVSFAGHSALIRVCQFLSSRPSTPNPFRPSRSNTATSLSPAANLSPLKQEANGAPSAGDDVKASHVVAKLEEAARGKVNDLGETVGENGNPS